MTMVESEISYGTKIGERDILGDENWGARHLRVEWTKRFLRQRTMETKTAQERILESEISYGTNGWEHDTFAEENRERERYLRGRRVRSKIS